MKLYANGKIVDDSNPLPVIVVGSGEGGSGGMRFLFGTTDPQPTDGEPGDVYLNTVSGDLFKNENGTWNLKGNLRGPEGPEGPQGPQGEPGPQGEQGPQGPAGRGISDITFDGETNELVFMMTDDTEIRLTWPSP